jgi:hypothetical protein
VSTAVIVQLMNEKEQLLATRETENDGYLIFDFLAPAKYKLKFIYDENNNHKWDTGDYLKKVQPEKIGYYKDEINIRSNWDLEVKMDLNQ